MMAKVPMTSDGYARLDAELRRLKTTERPKIIRAIAAAREHGDLSENAEYHAARERQAFVEGRVAGLEDIIRRAEIIDVSKLSGENVKFGATVTLSDEDTDEKRTFQLVGEHESDVDAGRLSINSPMARAVIGRTIGDSVEVTTPRGTRSFEVTGVEYRCGARAGRRFRASPQRRWARPGGAWRSAPQGRISPPRRWAPR